ncbi:MAG TPA: hypothetical protein DCY35_04675, partial [Prolixibacteraceae bacterium]|nr:hypothetical protein [Prolixibacteraceae bacterium]
MGVLSTILSLRQKRQEWEESRPLREAQLKAFKADYDMKKSRIDLFNALSEGPGDKIEQTGQQIDSKMKEMLLSGAGQMGQMTGAGGQGMQDIMGQMPQVQTPQMMQSGQPQQPNSGGRLLDILSNPEELARYKAAGIDLTPIANNLMNQQNINYDNALSRERLDWQKQQGD